LLLLQLIHKAKNKAGKGKTPNLQGIVNYYGFAAAIRNQSVVDFLVKNNEDTTIKDSVGNNFKKF
jgi:hypothetical protein